MLVLTEQDRQYITERVAYAIAALDEAGVSPNNLKAIIAQEIGLAIQHERTQQQNAPKAD